jgi:hypothetical protein
MTAALQVLSSAVHAAAALAWMAVIAPTRHETVRLASDSQDDPYSMGCPSFHGIITEYPGECS